MPNIAAIEQQVRPLFAAGRFEDAEALLRPYLASGSGPLPLWKLLAAAIRPQLKIAETRAIQEMLVANAPGDLPTRFDLSETLLLLGEFQRGWREYRYRYNLAHTTALDRKVQRPAWDGRPIPGQSLLIHDEQGYGDTFQFMRLVAWAKQRSQARVILEINPESASLARRFTGYDELVVKGALPPPFDLHCQMMTLPQTLGLKLTDLPGAIPYLSADPGRVQKWTQRLAGIAGLRITLVWAGRPAHPNDANRSMALAQLAPLAASGATFLSIQKGPASAQAATPPAGLSVVPLRDEIADFEDTAAILSIADLLVSVDSSPVHLAGALGRSAWVMLPFVPDWRWLLDRADTPWYPSVRLFRQGARGNWAGVVDDIARALAELPRRSGSVPVAG